MNDPAAHPGRRRRSDHPCHGCGCARPRSYSVVTATNGVEALAALDGEPSRPSLVLLDMRMPVLDGWGFMRAVRERGLNLSVVVMTAATDARRWGREIGAHGVLAKPFELDDLLSAVSQFRSQWCSES